MIPNLITVVSILLFSYFGSGALLAMHVWLTNRMMLRIVTDAPGDEIEVAVIWFLFLHGQNGGLWGTMARLFVDPLHFVRLAKEIDK